MRAVPSPSASAIRPTRVLATRPPASAMPSVAPTATCTFPDNGSYPVKGRIIDKNDGFGEYTTTVTVNNVAPTATLSNDGPINEGGSATVSFSGQSDPS